MNATYLLSSDNDSGLLASALSFFSRAEAGYRFHRRLSVCLFVYPHDISKTAAARITKLDIEMFHHDSWKPIYFGFKRSKVKGQGHEAQKGAFGFCIFCECWLLVFHIFLYFMIFVYFMYLIQNRIYVSVCRSVCLFVLYARPLF